jgi:hypothetical protein
MLRLEKTNDLELKKHIYLYLVNYSHTEPEQAIMAVRAFDGAVGVIERRESYGCFKHYYSDMRDQ